MKQMILKSLLLIAGLLVSTNASAYDFSVDGIYYNKSGSNATVTYKDSNYNSYSGDVVIPESVTYNGTTYNVTSIGYYAFRGCSGMTSVTIPNSVTSIGLSAFYVCSSLASVYITDMIAWCNIDFKDRSSNPLSTGARFYLNKKRVRDLVIPDGVTAIKNYAFYDCSGLTSVTIPNSVTSIGNSAFSSCSGLTSVTIPNSVTVIGDSAFESCRGLTSVAIPSSVTTIGVYAFFECSGLTSVTIPSSVTVIGSCAFWYCRGLTSVTISDGVTTIGGGAFCDCSGLTSVTIPNSVTVIGDSAFESCRGLTSVAIGNSVTSIGEYAFYFCSSLENVYITDVAAWCNIDFYDNISNPLCYADKLYLNNELVTNLVIPDGVTSISGWAFYDYGGLTSVTIPNSVTSIGEYAFCDCSGLTSVTIPNSVTSIGNYAFYGCSGLTSVTIGENVEKIGSYVFYNCKNLATINSLNPIPPLIESDTFRGVDKTTCTLNVPIDCKIEYQLEDYWKEFLNINEFDLSGVKNIAVDNDVTIAVNEGILSIGGLYDNAIIELYNTSGQMVYRGTETSIPVATSGIYILKLPTKTIKLTI